MISQKPHRSLPALALVLGAACAGGSGGPGPLATRTSADAEDERASAAEDANRPPRDSGDIPHYVDGAIQRRVSRDAAETQGLTLVDLGSHWTPRIFVEDTLLGDAGHQPFRRQYIRLANQETHAARRDPDKRHLELFGIFPSIDVVHRQLADAERHACHDAVDDAPIEAMERAMRPGADVAAQRRRAGAVRVLTNRLEEVAQRRRLESIDALESDRRYGRDLRRLRSLEGQGAAIHAVQAHLRCEGFLHSRARDGVLDAWTGRAIRAWQSKHMIVSLASRLDEATRATLAMDSRELDFLALLRALRERIVDATGVIADGTASGRWGTVLGRQLNVDDEFRWASRLDPLPNAAPDLVSQLTEAAAQALGWTDPESALAWFSENAAEPAESRVVALPLPPPPEYYTDHMDLRVEIDRGDVWYTFPYTDTGRPRGFPVRRRPLTTIYARHNGQDIPLVRWNTTIGGWQPEINPEGGIGMRYKDSDVGPRVWRDLVASPAWLPPPSTPDEELLRRHNGEWVPNRSITGPGYDSAYGMAMVIHHRVRNEGESPEDFMDNGIRSHGSVSYRSILRGHSHGCHRLFNHLAVRLTGFLLNRRNHEVRGRIPAALRRELHPEGSEETVMLEIDTRGFLYELTPPVPVNVLRGNVRGRPDRPPAGFFPLPEELQEQAAAALEADPSLGGAPSATPPTPGATPATPPATPPAPAP